MRATRARRARRTVSALLLGAATVPPPALADTVDLFPGASFEQAVESLQPGDTLVVHAGTYVDSGRISVTVRGTAALPVLITAAEGEARPLIARDAGDRAQNTINIEGATYLTVRGLEIRSNGGDGINLNSNPAYITLEDLVIHDVDVGINFRSSMHHITVRRNEIYDTGTESGDGTGEGMYIGCHEGDCAVSESLIEHNWVHHTANSSQGDGIEVKRGSHSNIIRDNVIHDTQYPCVLLYGTDGNPRNVVERNVMWNCWTAGIQAAADSVIRDNLILSDLGTAFESQSHAGVTPNNLEFVHNTIFGGEECLRLRGWEGKQGMVLANNAIYCESARYALSGLGGTTLSGNVLWPDTGALGGGYSPGRSAVLDFVDAAGRNLFPSADSALIGAGDPAFASAVDFRGSPREGAPTAGAFTAGGPVPAPVRPGFKERPDGALPSLVVRAVPDTVEPGGYAEVHWSASDAQVCLARGAWSGERATDGVERVGPLDEDTEYRLACVNEQGETQGSVTVRVNGPGPGGEQPGSEGPGGDDSSPLASAIDPACVLLPVALLVAGRTRRRRRLQSTSNT